MSIALRELSLADHGMVDELREAVGVDRGLPSPDRLAPAASGAKAFLADSNSFVIGAYVDHAVAGGIWGATIRHPSGATTLEARELYVITSVRRWGIGSLLVDAAMGLAARNRSQVFEVRAAGAAGIAEMCAALGSTSNPGVESWVL